jgi:hypothetical protein
MSDHSDLKDIATGDPPIPFGVDAVQFDLEADAWLNPAAKPLSDQDHTHTRMPLVWVWRIAEDYFVSLEDAHHRGHRWKLQPLTWPAGNAPWIRAKTAPERSM